MADDARKGLDRRWLDKNESKKGIDSKGSPLLRVGGVPGYNKGTGTPGYIRSAADAAEKRTDFNSSEHRSRAHQGGAPPYGTAKSPEKIKPGQAG